MAITHAKVSPKTDVADTDLVRPSDWNAAHVGTLDHAALSAVSADQHHARSHAHDGADGSGTVAGAALTGTPGGELGGTWSAPTVDPLHGGSTHAVAQAAAQATAAAALAAHAAAGDPHAGYATDADLAAHTGDTSDAHDASAVSSVPAGGLAAGNVQAALNELDTEKVPTTRTLTAGAGLAGGGTLAANRTFDVNVDGSTLEISADALRVKDGGITTAKLAFNPATQAELDAHTASAVMDGDAAGGDLSGAYPNPSVVNDSHSHGSGTAPGTAHPSLATHDALGLATDAELAAHTADTVDAHDASAISFTPAGTIAATNVQAAIEEVAAEAGTGGSFVPYVSRAGFPTGTGAVWELTLTGAPTGGTYTLDVTAEGHPTQTTAAIAWDAGTVDVFDALDALSEVTGFVAVDGAAPNVGVAVITFEASRGDVTIALNTNSLTGGASPDVDLAQTDEGRLDAQDAGLFDPTGPAIYRDTNFEALWEWQPLRETWTLVGTPPGLGDVLDENNNADGRLLSGLSDPVDPQDAATKAYVDAAAGGGTPATTVTDETTFGIAPAVGVATEYAREDHTHGTPASPLSGSAETYTESNVTTDRAFNANLTTIDELADVLGSLIIDLRARGLVA